MTPEEAEKRILLSLETLDRYIAMANGFDATPAPDTGTLLFEEIRILDGIAADYPAKAGKVRIIIKEWKRLIEHLGYERH